MVAATIWGTLPTWLILVVALFAAWRISNGGAGSAVSELTAANRALDKALHDARDKLGSEVSELRSQNSELRGRTDVAIALTPVLDWTQWHEQRAAERHAAMMVILDLIAERLGPDTNGHSGG
jgi:hypothetical protein